MESCDLVVDEKMRFLMNIFVVKVSVLRETSVLAGMNMNPTKCLYFCAILLIQVLVKKYHNYGIVAIGICGL
jgi:hypothetical protein